MPNESAEQTQQTEQQTQQTQQTQQKPDGQQTAQQTTQQTQNPASTGNNSGETWEREKRGLIGETQRERAARQKAESDFQSLKTQYELATKRINALAGINPKTQSETDDEEIKAAFAAKFPHLAQLTAEDIEAIRETRQQSTQLKASSDAMWKRHTNQVLSTLNTTVADKLGGGDLSPKQKDTLRREYIAYIEEGQAAGKDYISRHEAGDETLIEEFADAYLKEWQEPIRRSVTSTEINRPTRPLPNGKGRNIAVQQPKKIDFTNDKAMEDAAVEVFKAHGGTFTG